MEERAMEKLREARTLGSLEAIDAADALLNRSTERPAADWRARIFELAEALFQSVRMQLSVPRYKAISVDRGANLDTVDMPLNSRGWLRQRFAEVRAATSESERLRGVERIVEWTNPGPGGFYDDLGNAAQQPHLVRGPGFDKDPAFLESALANFRYRADARKSWWDTSDSLVDAPLRMRYTELDPTAEYRLRVVYAGDSPTRKIRLNAGSLEIHPLIDKPSPVRPLEFDIPREATRGGTLDLEWRREPGLGGSGRGCQVAEVWLMRK
jgi:hypothetical protein